MPQLNSGGVGGMFDNLKSRLGFNRDEDKYEDDYVEDEEYDDYDEYDEYGPGYDDDAGAEPGAYRPATTSSSRSRSRSFGRANSTPDLVSIDDVKASTQVPDRLQRDPLADSDGYSTRTSRSGTFGTRNVIDNTAPAPSSPAHNAAMRGDARKRSEGLDSLFEPSSSSYDPYEAYSGGSSGVHSPGRALEVIRPTLYGDVEKVAKAVKSGDVVVLVLRHTPDDLAKRILDFSFGVASALDANVECPADKVFAIARGNALSDSEKRYLRSQGAF